MKKLTLVIGLIIAQQLAAQNVGIGLTTPMAPLHLKSATATEMLRLESPGPYISFYNGAGVYSGYVWYNSLTTNMELGTPALSNKTVAIAPNVNPMAFFTPSGDVGIGYANPIGLLHLHDAGSSNSHLRFTHSSSGTLTTDGLRVGMSGSSALFQNLENSNILFGTNNLNRVAIDAAGNMGVGNLAPTYRLDVTGDVNLTGTLRIDGSSGIAGQVLTSNGVSSPFWQTTRYGFGGQDGSAGPIEHLVQTKIIVPQAFDDGNIYDPGTGEVTIPVAGVYHFDAQANFFTAPNGNYQIYLDNNTNLADGYYAFAYATSTSATTRLTVDISVTLFLNAGQTVIAHMFQNSGDTQNFVGFFSGFKVY